MALLTPRPERALFSASPQCAPQSAVTEFCLTKAQKKNRKQKPEDAVGDCHARGLPLCKCVQTDATHTLTLSFYDSCSATPALLSLTFTSAPPSHPHFRPSTSGKTRVSSISISTQVGALHHHQAHNQEHSINQSLNACSADPAPSWRSFNRGLRLRSHQRARHCTQSRSQIAMAPENSSSSPQTSTQDPRQCISSFAN